MKKILYLLLIALTSCTNIKPTETLLIPTTQVLPTATLLPATSTPTLTPSITPTVENTCDPSREAYCITEGHFILARPIHPPADDLVDATYLYGSTANGTRDPHHGVEFPNPTGTPVYAAADGTVLFAEADQQAPYSPWGNYYGNLVVIEHKDKLFTLYAHLSKIDVTAGQNVSEGDRIGEVGSTGVAIGSHLHFEVRRGNVEDYFATQNPELWLSPAKDGNGNLFGTLAISAVDQAGYPVNDAKFTVNYYLSQSQSPVRSYYGTTYASDMLNGDENAVLGELPAGRYRIVIIMNGQMYERWVEVESGKLTQVAFVVK